MSNSSAGSRHEASATVTLLQAMSRFRQAFPQLSDEDFKVSVMSILPPHFDKVLDVWDEACEHFKTLDNLMRLIDGIAHALAVSSGDQGDSGADVKRAEQQVDSKEFLKKLNERLVSTGAAKREAQPPAPELVDLTQDEPEVKPNIKLEAGKELRDIFAQDGGQASVQVAATRRISAPATVQLKKARLSLPPAPPAPVDQSARLALQASNYLSSAMIPASKTKAATKPVAARKQPINGKRPVVFEIVNEEFSIARRREFFHEYTPCEKGFTLNFRSGPVKAMGFGRLYLIKYGNISAYHVPDWRTDAISYRMVTKRLHSPIDQDAFHRLLRDKMEGSEPRKISFELRLNEFDWTEKKQLSLVQAPANNQ